MARDTDSIASRLSVLEALIPRRPGNDGRTLADLPHCLLIGRLASELLPLVPRVGSVAMADQKRVGDLSGRLYALLQLDGCCETSDARLAGLLDWIAATETEPDEEFWAAGWPAQALPRSRNDYPTPQ